MNENNIIYFDEIKIKYAIAAAEDALTKARTSISDGMYISPKIISRLENIIVSLEEKLIKLIEEEENR